eukprot:467257_1
MSVEVSKWRLSLHMSEGAAVTLDDPQFLELTSQSAPSSSANDSAAIVTVRACSQSRAPSGLWRVRKCAAEIPGMALEAVGAPPTGEVRVGLREPAVKIELAPSLSTPLRLVLGASQTLPVRVTALERPVTGAHLHVTGGETSALVVTSSEDGRIPISDLLSHASCSVPVTVSLPPGEAGSFEPTMETISVEVDYRNESGIELSVSEEFSISFFPLLSMEFSVHRHLPTSTFLQIMLNCETSEPITVSSACLTLPKNLRISADPNPTGGSGIVRPSRGLSFVYVIDQSNNSDSDDVKDENGEASFSLTWSCDPPNDSNENPEATCLRWNIDLPGIHSPDPFYVAVKSVPDTTTVGSFIQLTITVRHDSDRFDPHVDTQSGGHSTAHTSPQRLLCELDLDQSVWLLTGKRRNVMDFSIDKRGNFCRMVCGLVPLIAGTLALPNVRLLTFNENGEKSSFLAEIDESKIIRDMNSDSINVYPENVTEIPMIEIQ